MNYLLSPLLEATAVDPAFASFAVKATRYISDLLKVGGSYGAAHELSTGSAAALGLGFLSHSG